MEDELATIVPLEFVDLLRLQSTPVISVNVGVRRLET